MKAPGAFVRSLYTNRRAREPFSCEAGSNAVRRRRMTRSLSCAPPASSARAAFARRPEPPPAVRATALARAAWSDQSSKAAEHLAHLFATNPIHRRLHAVFLVETSRDDRTGWSRSTRSLRSLRWKKTARAVPSLATNSPPEIFRLSTVFTLSSPRTRPVDRQVPSRRCGPRRRRCAIVSPVRPRADSAHRCSSRPMRIDRR